jgi:hypothetical protein
MLLWIWTGGKNYQPQVHLRLLLPFFLFFSFLFSHCLWLVSFNQIASVTVTADVMTSPYALPIVSEWLSSHGVSFSTMVNDVDVAVQLERIAAPSTGNDGIISYLSIVYFIASSS